MDVAAVQATECLKKLRGNLSHGFCCSSVNRMFDEAERGLWAMLFTGAVQCFQADINHVARPFDRKSFTREYNTFTILTPFTVGSVL